MREEALITIKETGIGVLSDIGMFEFGTRMSVRFGVCEVSVSPNSHLCQSVLVVLFVKLLQPFVY